VASTDGNSAVQVDAVMPVAKACLGSEKIGAQGGGLYFYLFLI